jgi:two-component system phosphate regulon response regulator PhoB
MNTHPAMQRQQQQEPVMPAQILVVDDDANLREIVVLKLQLAGFETHAVNDGEAGLSAAQERTPDLIVLDWMMPKMTGLEVSRALREDTRTSEIPIIMLTAKAQVDDLRRGFDAGATDYMVKPFNPSELVARVSAALTRAV